MERLLRFETIVAICALLISAITGSAVVYQTHIIQNQYAATIWPYLNIDTNVTDPRHVELVLTNNGLGPALIRSAQLFVDGKHLPSWRDLALQIMRDAKHGHASFGTSSINASTTLRPGETQQLFTVRLASDVSPAVLKRHVVMLRFCYCSLNNACWSVQSVIGEVRGEYPQSVASCPIDAGISTPLL